MLCFQPPNHLLSSHFKFKSSFKTSVAVTCSQQADEFLPWLQAKSGCEISSLVSVGDSLYGRSLFASKPIQAGDSILKIPFTVNLTSHHLPSEIVSMLSDDVGHIARLSIVILMEQSKGKDSEWEPYINILPLPGTMHSPILWSKEELEMIRQSTVYQQTNDRKAQIEREYFALRPALDKFSNFLEDVTFEDFLHTYSVVESRAWGNYMAVSLVPFADFLNHDGLSQTTLQYDEEKQSSELFAGQNYAPGTQVLISYGNFPNSMLLLDFGFTLSYNVHDQVQIEMNVPQHDPLRTMKMELLQKYSFPTPEASNLDTFWNTFSLKEVRPGDGLGEGIPHSLRAFARILCINTIEELGELEFEAVQIGGRLARFPLKNTRKEIESHQLLLSRLATLIQDYDVFITSLEIPSDKELGGDIGIRTQLVHDLLSGELRVLRSASTWLNSYCTTLSEDKSTAMELSS